MSPTQAGKPGVIAVGCDPLGVGFDCQRSEICIRNERPFCCSSPAEASKDLPMHNARSHWDAGGMIAQGVRKFQCVVQAGRLGKNSGMRDNSHDAAQNQLRHPDLLTGAKRFLEPCLVHRVIAGIHPIRVNEYVNVD